MELWIIGIIVVIAVIAIIATVMSGSSDEDIIVPPSRRRPSRTVVSPIRVRPTARRMRTGGTAYGIHRDDFVSDMLFLAALDAALIYDEMHFADAMYMDSPFLHDTFDYSGSEFEEFATAEPMPAEEPVYEDEPFTAEEPVYEAEVVEPVYEEPEATVFEDLTTIDDEDTKTGWDSGGSDDGGWGSSDDGGSDDD